MKHSSDRIPTEGELIAEREAVKEHMAKNKFYKFAVTYECGGRIMTDVVSNCFNASDAEASVRSTCSMLGMIPSNFKFEIVGEDANEKA